MLGGRPACLHHTVVGLDSCQAFLSVSRKLSHSRAGLLHEPCKTGCSMSTHRIVCPDCLTPATLLFEFGSPFDPHAYYHCGPCGHGCAVQQLPAGSLRLRSAWRKPPTGTEPLKGGE